MRFFIEILKIDSPVRLAAKIKADRATIMLSLLFQEMPSML